MARLCRRWSLMGRLSPAKVLLFVVLCLILSTASEEIVRLPHPDGTEIVHSLPLQTRFIEKRSYSIVDSSRISTFLISILLIVYGSFRSMNMEQEAKERAAKDPTAAPLLDSSGAATDGQSKEKVHELMKKEVH
ncbi:unnamed protein product [Cyprideis torosa]|uniref:Uncharacterized protein n=1 Tax=Cyprideis torosa TaxID=163714 RepID=A0A7R8WE56_9CRUS|nr:unnamed protein product [Cyprideis torosa]CAG0889064.1 unnamed protein product [Cyprideis torosa]